jgi:acetaldehyde dehydrogenase (acetylating)
MTGTPAQVAIIGSGNIGSDLMIKVERLSGLLETAAMVGIDPDSDGLARARRMGIATTARGIDGLLEMDQFAQVELVFDATSAGAHVVTDATLRGHRVRIVDLTPAALGPRRTGRLVRRPTARRRNMSTLVFETGRPARIGDYADTTGMWPLTSAARGRTARPSAHRSASKAGCGGS